MLELKIPQRQFFDQQMQSFIVVPSCVLQLQHSLISLSKWQAKWNKPFMNNQGHDWKQIIDYIRFMTVNKNVDPNVYLSITPNMYQPIAKYIQAPMTATTFRQKPGVGHGRQIITAQIIYFWMIQNDIPFECQKWHLNRLLTLIRVCGQMNSSGKKMGKNNVAKQNRQLNAARRARTNSRG